MILITGGSGLIGRALSERLLEDGKRLRLQVRNQSQLAWLGSSNGSVEIQEVDFNRAGERQFQHLVNGCDTILHTAGLVHKPQAAFPEYDLLNMRTTRQLANAAAEAGVRTLVFFSTVAVYGNGPFENITEQHPLQPVTPYAVSKANAEQDLNRIAGLPRVIILRPAMVFGEGDRGNLIKFIAQLNRGRFFYLGNKPVNKSVIYSRDVAAATAACLASLPDGLHTFNLANPRPVALRELTELVSACLGRRPHYPTLPEGFVCLAIKSLEAMLGAASPVTWEQIERLNTSVTVSAEQLIKATGFTPKWALAQALKNEIDWAYAAGRLSKPNSA